MKKFASVLRLLVTVLLLLMAGFGIGITGNFLDNNRERFMNTRVKTEQVEKREEEEDEE